MILYTAALLKGFIGCSFLSVLGVSYVNIHIMCKQGFFDIFLFHTCPLISLPFSLLFVRPQTAHWMRVDRVESLIIVLISVGILWDFIQYNFVNSFNTHKLFLGFGIIFQFLVSLRVLSLMHFTGENIRLSRHFCWNITVSLECSWFDHDGWFFAIFLKFCLHLFIFQEEVCFYYLYLPKIFIYSLSMSLSGFDISVTLRFLSVSIVIIEYSDRIM